MRNVMRSNASRDTAPEWSLRRILHAEGYRYRTHVRPEPELNQRADLVFRKAKVAVFVDGWYWHGCPRHFVPPRTNADYWHAKISRNRIRDQETNRILRRSGWRVLRIWEHDDPTKSAARVRKALD